MLISTKIRFLLLYILLLSAVSLPAQSSYAIHRTTKDGLPSNKVYCAYQDVSGFMWFGTDNGLVRYNGSEFKNFSVKDGLPDNDIFSVFEDKDFRLWIIGFKQAPCYFYKNKLYTTANDTFLEKYFKNTDMFQIAVDQGQKRIFFYILFNGIYNMVEYGSIRPLPLSSSNAVSKGSPFKLFHTNNADYLMSGKGLINLSKNSFNVNPQQETIIDVDQVNVNGRDIGIAIPSTKDKIILFDIVADSIHPVKIIIKDSLIGLFNNARGNAIVLLENGSIYTLNKNTLELDKVNYKITGCRLSTGYIDNDGNKWICTHDNGFFILPQNSAEILETNNEKGATSIVYNPDTRTINVGFENNTIYSYGSSSFYTKHDFFKRRLKARITGMVYSKGNIYVGGDTRLGVFNVLKNEYKVYTKVNSITFSSIKDIELSGSGDILIGSANGASILTLNNTVDEIWNIRTTAIKETKDGDVYLGTINGLHIRKRGSTQVVLIKTNTGLDKARITDIEIDKSGRVWVGTAQCGLFIFDKEDIKNLNDDKNSTCYISSYYVKNIFIDTEDKAWISTDKGLNKVDLDKDFSTCTVERITSSFSIPDENINASWVLGDSIYLASLSGVYRMFYSKSQSKETPGIQILGTFVNFKPIDLDSTVKLSSNENNISIDFSAIAYRNPESIEFRYRLIGSDDHWIKSKSGHIDMLSLPPGLYRFEVKAVNLITDEGSDIKYVAFNILKPWYWQTWFLLIVLLALILIIRFIILIRTRRIKHKSEESSKINKQVAELEMQALRAQMNPHFIFNALSAIQNYFANNNEEKANSYMSKFSRLIRQMLEYSKNNFIPLDEEISLIENYMELEKMRFENKLEFNLIIQNTIDPTEYKIPSLLLQPILENAVNHGIRPSKSPGIINLLISMDGENLICDISDNGVGIHKSNEEHNNDKSTHNSKGIEILTKRIESMNQLYNCNISFSILDISGRDPNKTGTNVILKFPSELVSESILKLK